MSGVTIAMPSHKMSIIQIDGGNDIEPIEAASSIGILYPGERIDVIISRAENSAIAEAEYFTIILDDEFVTY